jgi:hypothetical protein
MRAGRFSVDTMFRGSLHFLGCRYARLMSDTLLQSVSSRGDSAHCMGLSSGVRALRLKADRHYVPSAGPADRESRGVIPPEARRVGPAADLKIMGQ